MPPSPPASEPAAGVSLRQLFKWSLMSGAVFWSLVYKLSASGLHVPDFVYVNF